MRAYVCGDHMMLRVPSLTSEEVNVHESSLQQQDGSKKRRQEVWRRYSEFEMLRSFLSTVYPYVRKEGGKEG